MLTHSQKIGIALLIASFVVFASSFIWRRLPIGTRSVLLGAHCFFLHPFFLAAAWTRLYGFPRDPRLWVAFVVHDLGYWGKANMDGPEGETHPEFGARIMNLFDTRRVIYAPENGFHMVSAGVVRGTYWRDLALCHSRYYAKRLNKPFSKLCVADKLAFTLTPRWLYLPMVIFTGEIYEYLDRAESDRKDSQWKARDFSRDMTGWHEALRIYMLSWVEKHRNGEQDTWTNPNRHGCIGSPYCTPESDKEYMHALACPVHKGWPDPFDRDSEADTCKACSFSSIPCERHRITMKPLAFLQQSKPCCGNHK